MKNTKEFNEFIKKIQITPEQDEAAKNGHETLRSQLLAAEDLKPSIVTTFLQGSYKRSTIVRPEGDDKVDVDLVVVTNFSDKLPPREVLGFFEPFVKKHYSGKWEPQGRSIGIKLRNVELDLVITATPPEEIITEMAKFDHDFGSQFSQFDNRQETEFNLSLEDLFSSKYESYLTEDNHSGRNLFLQDVKRTVGDWQANPLLIPDRDANEWRETNPLAQIEWTKGKNAETNGHFLHVVKAIKWWKSHESDLPKYPKSYPLEHMTGDCCPNNPKSLAEAFVGTLHNMIQNYKPYGGTWSKPFLEDRGCKDVDVLSRVEEEDFKTFGAVVEKIYPIANKALESNNAEESRGLWLQIFGEEFQATDGETTQESNAVYSSTTPAFTPREKPSEPSTGRFS